MSGDVNRKLGITVEATDLASGKLSKVKGELAGIGKQAGVSGSSWSRFIGGVESGAGRMKNAISGAVSHAKMRLTSLASSATTLLGIGGIFGGFALVGKSIEEAATFGANVSNVAKVTGLAIPVASAMVDTLDKWGVSSDRPILLLGKLEKNLGAIAGHKGGLAAFRKEFGVSLTTSNGKIADANTLLLRSADYFNSNATATQKATFLSKLYGKQWQDLIPILSKGSGFIKAQEKDSIKLTQQQLDNITKYRSASREFQDTMGDLEVKIGANLMPLLTKGLTAVSGWVDSHANEIATFFGNAGDMAGAAVGGAIDLFNAVKAGWETVPPPLRDLLIKGAAADRVTKFIFGFSPIQLAIKAGEGLLGGVASAVGKSVAGGLLGAGIGKLFVQPVFVTNMGLGGIGGAGGIAGKVGGAGALLTGAAVGLAAAAVGLAVQTYFDTTNASRAQASDIHTTLKTSLADSPPLEDLKTKLGAIDSGIAKIDANPLLRLIHGDAYRELQSMRTDVASAIAVRTGQVVSPDLRDIRDAAQSTVAAIRDLPAALRIEIGTKLSTTVRDSYYKDGGTTPTSTDKNTSTGYVPIGAGEYGGLHASGMFGLTSGKTPLGYAGEAGTEAVAVIRNPRPFGIQNAMSNVTNETALAALERAFERHAQRLEGIVDRHGRTAKPAVMSARQAEGATARQTSYGPTRARQLAYSG